MRLACRIPARSALFTALVPLLATLPAAAHAQAACDLVTAQEAAALVGAPAPTRSSRASCRWGTAVTAGRKGLIAIVFTHLPPPALGAMRRSAAEDGRELRDEPSIAPQAVSVLTEFGVVVLMPKGDRLLQFQYHAGHPGVNADRDAVRPVAKSAYTRF